MAAWCVGVPSTTTGTISAAPTATTGIHIIVTIMGDFVWSVALNHDRDSNDASHSRIAGQTGIMTGFLR